MNAPSPKLTPAPDQDFAAMTGNANLWRAECIQRFAELEQIVGTLLLDLRAAPRFGAKVTLGKQVRPAFEQLRELTGSKGPFASKGKSISQTLAELAPWFEWRAHLTHGVMTVWRGRNGQWLLALAHRQNGEDPIHIHALTWEDAQGLRKLLQERVAALHENARSLSNSVRKSA